MVRIIYENFSPWGEIENINYIHVKSACYIMEMEKGEKLHYYIF